MAETNMKIMVPVDFTSHTGKLVEYSVSMAQKLSAQVKFVHIAESFSGYDMLLVHPSFSQISEELKDKAEKLMENLIDEYKDQLPKVSGQVMIGDTVDKLLECAEKEHFDLIIIGTRGTRGLEKILMGSVADKMSKYAPCPILIVNPDYLKNM